MAMPLDEQKIQLCVVSKRLHNYMHALISIHNIILLGGRQQRRTHTWSITEVKLLMLRCQSQLGATDVWTYAWHSTTATSVLSLCATAESMI